MPTNPYHADLAGRDAISAMRETPARIEAIVAHMTEADLARSYAPGKWTAAQLLVHLAQAELALTVRARMALTEPNYVAQPFDQDRWLEREAAGDGRTALAAYLAMRRLNLQLFSSLSEAARATTFDHPEYGQLTVQWLLEMIAGHELHHVVHFEAIAAG
jgi:DinB superfamily